MTTEAEAVEYFASLSYKDQRKFYGKLARHHKSPSYSLRFKLEPRGVKLMATAVSYCQECNISYQPKKVNAKMVKFIFDDAQTRNKVMLRCMGGKSIEPETACGCEADFNLERGDNDRRS